MRVSTKTFAVPIVALLAIGIMPIFAEVSDLYANQRMYFLGDDMIFSGSVEKGTTGLVTIVIRDSNDKFVLLTQAIIDANNIFEKKVEINNKFTIHGTYNATAFIQNMTAGAKTTFDVSTNGSIFLYGDIQEEETSNNPETTDKSNSQETSPQPQTTTYSEPKPETSQIADFVDPQKDPQYYLDRYYNEPAYKSWFDVNYPGMTIEDAVGYEKPVSIEDEINEIIPEEIIPDAEALSAPDPDSIEPSSMSGETAQMALAIGGLGILLGAVYGVKRKVDSNTEEISKNRDTIKKKFLGAILSNDPLSVIRERLAKGEITIEEFNDLKKTLSRES